MYLDNLLFDEKIFMYMEEVDLLMRARLKGYKTYFYPGSRIIHLGSGSSINKRSGPVLNIYKGLMYVYQKHYSQTALVSLRVLLQTKAIIAWCIGWLTGNSYLTSTYVQAYKLV
jgi:GT2 family glycosyltransferase